MSIGALALLVGWCASLLVGWGAGAVGWGDEPWKGSVGVVQLSPTAQKGCEEVF